eukprot:Rmarinus@m.1321
MNGDDSVEPSPQTLPHRTDDSNIVEVGLEASGDDPVLHSAVNLDPTATTATNTDSISEVPPPSTALSFAVPEDPKDIQAHIENISEAEKDVELDLWCEGGICLPSGSSDPSVPDATPGADGGSNATTVNPVVEAEVDADATQARTESVQPAIDAEVGATSKPCRDEVAAASCPVGAQVTSVATTAGDSCHEAGSDPPSATPYPTEAGSTTDPSTSTAAHVDSTADTSTSTAAQPDSSTDPSTNIAAQPDADSKTDPCTAAHVDSSTNPSISIAAQPDAMLSSEVEVGHLPSLEAAGRSSTDHDLAVRTNSASVDACRVPETESAPIADPAGSSLPEAAVESAPSTTPCAEDLSAVSSAPEGRQDRSLPSLSTSEPGTSNDPHSESAPATAIELGFSSESQPIPKCDTALVESDPVSPPANAVSLQEPEETSYENGLPTACATQASPESKTTLDSVAPSDPEFVPEVAAIDSVAQETAPEIVANDATAQKPAPEIDASATAHLAADDADALRAPESETIPVSASVPQLDDECFPEASAGTASEFTTDVTPTTQPIDNVNPASKIVPEDIADSSTSQAEPTCVHAAVPEPQPLSESSSPESASLEAEASSLSTNNALQPRISDVCAPNQADENNNSPAEENVINSDEAMTIPHDTQPSVRKSSVGATEDPWESSATLASTVSDPTSRRASLSGEPAPDAVTEDSSVPSRGLEETTENLYADAVPPPDVPPTSVTTPSSLAAPPDSVPASGSSLASIPVPVSAPDSGSASSSPPTVLENGDDGCALPLMPSESSRRESIPAVTNSCSALDSSPTSEEVVNNATIVPTSTSPETTIATVVQTSDPIPTQPPPPPAVEEDGTSDTIPKTSEAESVPDPTDTEAATPPEDGLSGIAPRATDGAATPSTLSSDPPRRSSSPAAPSVAVPGAAFLSGGGSKSKTRMKVRVPSSASAGHLQRPTHPPPKPPMAGAATSTGQGPSRGSFLSADSPMGADGENAPPSPPKSQSPPSKMSSEPCECEPIESSAASPSVPAAVSPRTSTEQTGKYTFEDVVSRDEALLLSAADENEIAAAAYAVFAKPPNERTAQEQAYVLAMKGYLQYVRAYAGHIGQKHLNDTEEDICVRYEVQSHTASGSAILAIDPARRTPRENAYVAGLSRAVATLPKAETVRSEVRAQALMSPQDQQARRFCMFVARLHGLCSWTGGHLAPDFEQLVQKLGCPRKAAEMMKRIQEAQLQGKSVETDYLDDTTCPLPREPKLSDDLSDW